MPAPLNSQPKTNKETVKIDNSLVIDEGDGIRVANGASKEAIDFTVELAKKRFGSSLKVKGNKELCREISGRISRGIER